MSSHTMVRSLNILIPTFARPAALAVTLTSLCGQTYPDFDVIISDQTEDMDPFQAGEVRTVVRLLMLYGHRVSLHKHLPRRGIAEQRQFLLERSSSYYVLYLDDDLILEPDLVMRMMRAIRDENCGFVGSAPIGLGSIDDERPGLRSIELRDGRVRPERITPDSAERQRHHLHSAANILHAEKRLDLEPRQDRTYPVAWIGACVLYDVEKLDAVNGFRSWKEIPENLSGEDALVQTRMLERFGGCRIVPSGVYHQELPTIGPDRSIKAIDLPGKAPAKGANILIEVPAGELIDKITILEIKARKITGPAGLQHVREELEHLCSVRDLAVPSSDGLAALVQQLQEVNLALWQIEDDIRECERKQDFGPGFIGLARAVYHKNDLRANIKRSINELTGSRLMEEKSYAFYKAA